MPRIHAFQIGNARVICIVVVIVPHCRVQLPQVLQLSRVLNLIVRRGRSALLRPVVHNRYPRRNRLHQRRATTPVHPMVAHNVHIHSSQLVHRAHQRPLLRPCQVAQVQNSQPPKRNHHPNRAVVLAAFRILRRRGRTLWIHRARTPTHQRLADHLAIRAHHLHPHPVHRQHVARLYRKPRQMSLRQHLLVRRPARERRRIVGLRIVAMVNHPPHRNLRQQLGHAPHMVGVEVRHHQVVDLRHARLLAQRHNPVCIAPSRPRPARIHQQALTPRSDKQRSLPPLHIGKVHPQIPTTLLHRHRRSCRRPQRNPNRHRSHPHEPSHPVLLFPKHSPAVAGQR